MHEGSSTDVMIVPQRQNIQNAPHDKPQTPFCKQLRESQ